MVNGKTLERKHSSVGINSFVPNKVKVKVNFIVQKKKNLIQEFLVKTIDILN